MMDMPSFLRAGTREKEETAKGFAGRRVGISLSISIASVENRVRYLMDASGCGFPNFFGSKTWNEVVCKDSSYFPNGVLKVHVTEENLRVWGREKGR